MAAQQLKLPITASTSAQVGLGMKADNSYNLIYIDLSVEVSRINNVQSQNLI
ncbi:hypothetical protein [Pseudoalteromonas sp. MIP2626]|jgi:hypothetical protein|uniref:hypothetical protein n=1 Tax=unclassified Pseudoalteromonas TaxID=194690 RepID=UPI001C544F2B|nr:hypothetical protein [Pseudoalteromonas sp. MIP2626]